MTPRHRDRLGLGQTPTSTRIRFGDVDVTAALRDATFRTALEELPTASMVLANDLIPAEADFLSEVTVSADEAGWSRDQLFRGNVESAEVGGALTAIECRGGLVMTDSAAGPFASARMQAEPIIHLVARESGLSEDRVSIEGLNAMEEQAFEVVAPLDDLTMGDGSRPVYLGPVTLIGLEQASVLIDDILGNGDAAADLKKRFTEASAFAMCHSTAVVPYEAEQRSLAMIDWVLAWLTVRLRYGLVRLPTGEQQDFDRASSRTLPRRKPLVAIRGVRTRGGWVRGVDGASLSSALSADLARDIRIPPRISEAHKQALLAAQRAAAAGDWIQRVGAIWESIEFLVRGVDVAKPLSKDAKNEMRSELGKRLSESDHDRIERLIQLVNDPPLFRKLRAFIESHEVPFTEGDMNLLGRLRDLRNGALHGRGAGERPDPEELDHAVALVSRLALFSLHATYKVAHPSSTPIAGQSSDSGERGESSS
jgi:hypothetical protein